MVKKPYKRNRNGMGKNPLSNGRNRGAAQKRQPRRRANGNRGRAKRQVGAAVAYATGVSSGQPQFTRSANECRIVHRELIDSISGTPDFAVSKNYPLNPGISKTFPWLSQEAAGWEKYKFNSLTFRYYTRCASNAQGSVLFAPDYDPDDSPPTNEQQAASFRDAQEDAPWKDIVCHLNHKDMLGGLTDKYVRLGNLAPSQDYKLTDSGIMFMCTNAGNNIGWGKVWVEYDVTFRVPQNKSDVVLFAGSFGVHATTGVSYTDPFGTAPILYGGLDVLVAPSSITIGRVGQYLIQFLFSGTGVSSGSLLGLGGTAPTIAILIPTTQNSAATVGATTVVAVITEPGQTVFFGFNTVASTVTETRMSISPGSYLVLNDVYV